MFAVEGINRFQPWEGEVIWGYKISVFSRKIAILPQSRPSFSLF